MVMNAARMLGVGPLLLALLVFATGCQRPVGLHPVSGKVSYKGAALNNGVVVFTPDASRGESGPIALGNIREDGTFALSTGDAPGATAGWYRVTVAAFAKSSVPLLPEKYGNPELSLLRCEIKASQANAIDLNLD
jgi:hypothetical protein